MTTRINLPLGVANEVFEHASAMTSMPLTDPAQEKGARILACLKNGAFVPQRNGDCALLLEALDGWVGDPNGLQSVSPATKAAARRIAIELKNALDSLQYGDES